MTETRRSVALALGLGLVATTAFAQSADKVRIGLIQTLSGPSAVLGQQARDGFKLAVKELGGKLGGRRRRGDRRRRRAEARRRGHARSRGCSSATRSTSWSARSSPTSLLAIHKPIVDANAFLISANAGPSKLAGKELQPVLLRHLLPERPEPRGAGQGTRRTAATRRSTCSRPNYQAGKDALAGFKRHFKGEIVEESYVPLGTARFPVRARQDRRRASPTRSSSSCRAAWA